jgi:cephalosporin hydroxylase
MDDDLRTLCETAMLVGRKVDLTGCFHEIAGQYAFEACNYYPLLAGLATTLGATQVLDIGTRFGGSILAAARGVSAEPGTSGVLVTVDVKDHPGHALDAHPEIIRIVGDAAEAATVERVVRLFHPPIDMLYLDALHTREHTRACFDAYTAQLAPAIVVVDDIHLNPSMRAFWEELRARFPAQQVYDATELVGRGTECGFGVVWCRTLR